MQTLHLNHTGLVLPMDRSNVDTDQIIPKQFLKRIERTGFGQFLFFDWRFRDDGSDNPDFELNRPEYRRGERSCWRGGISAAAPAGSTPLGRWRITVSACLIAPSFADIFYNNCFKNGLLADSLDEAAIDDLFARAPHIAATG